MNNKQLFEQSAGKILSANQLEGVMRLHNALFEGSNPEQVADTVADAVKDAVDDSLDAIADQQVANDVSEVSSITVSPEDKIRLESLFGSMSDDEKQAFLESLDEQQMQILTEGVGSVFKTFRNMFTKQGRKANRFDKFSKLAKKDADLTRRLDQVGDLNNVSPRTARKLDKMFDKRENVRRKMNDLSVKASNDPAEYERMQQEGLRQGSRNIQRETMDAERTRLLNEKDQLLNEANARRAKAVEKLKPIKDEADAKVAALKQEYKQRLEQLEKTVPEDYLAEEKKNLDKWYADAYKNAMKDYNSKYNRAMNAYNKEIEGIAAYDNKVNDLSNRMNRAREEAGGFYAGARNGATVNNGRPFNGPNFNGNPNAQPFTNPYMNPEYWKQFTRKFSTMRKVSTVLLGSVHAAVNALKLAAVGAAAYGGYKLYDFFANPQEVDLNLGDGSGRITDNVKKVIAILAGGVAGRIAAKFIGFDSTTGKNVGTLLGAVLVAYFMYLNGGDEDNAKEMLSEFNNASDTDQEAIKEALNIPGFAKQLQEVFNENASLI